MQGTSDPNAELLDAAALCGHLVPAGSVHAFLAEHRRRLFPDELFADLFPSGRGRPSVPADVIATVIVLQALEGLSDRDALGELRTNIAWKVAAGLGLADAGFHPTVLTLWRNKLRATDAPERIFDAVRAVVAETGLLRGKTRRVLDSTVLDDAVATQDTVTQLIAAIRRVRRLVPQAGALDAHDYADPSKPRIAWDDAEARAALITALVNDALAVLGGLEGLDLGDEAADAVGLLALVAGQDVEPGDEDGTWRIARRTAPDRVISTVDPDARHVHKTVHHYRDGYKAHVVVEPVTGLICAHRLSAGNVPDGRVDVALMACEPKGRQVLGDSAYGSGEKEPRCARASTASPSSPGPRRTPADSAATTFLSITTLAPPPVPQGTPSGSRPPTTPCSGASVAAAICASTAPQPARGPGIFPPTGADASQPGGPGIRRPALPPPGRHQAQDLHFEPPPIDHDVVVAHMVNPVETPPHRHVLVFSPMRLRNR